MTKQLAVLLGKSLLIDGVAAELSRDETFKVICFECVSAGLVRYLMSQQRILIVFERNTISSGMVFALIDRLPNSQILALDPAGCRHLCIAGCRYSARSMQDLLAILTKLLYQAKCRHEICLGKPEYVSACSENGHIAVKGES